MMLAIAKSTPLLWGEGAAQRRVRGDHMFQSPHPATSLRSVCHLLPEEKVFGDPNDK